MADLKVLRIRIAGRWYAHEWTELLGATAGMYSTVALLYLLNDLQKKRKTHPKFAAYIAKRTEEITSILLSDDDEKKFSFLETGDFSVESKTFKMDVPRNLEILRIRYGSPGDIDFLGIGKIVEAIARAYERTLDFINDRPKRREKKLEEIKRIIEMAKSGGLSDKEIEELTVRMLSAHDRTFRKFIRQHKLSKHPTVIPPPKRA